MYAGEGVPIGHAVFVFVLLGQSLSNPGVNQDSQIVKSLYRSSDP
jgi:hypothetical protein